MTGPLMSSYYASKNYVVRLTLAIREELRRAGSNVKISVFCPGPVDTEFFDIAEKYGKTLSVKKLTMVTADRVVKQAIKDSYHKKALSVCSLPIKAFHGLTKLLPHSLIFHVMRMMYR